MSLPPPTAHALTAIAALTARDLRRLLRRPTQLVAVFGVPALFAVLMGAGFSAGIEGYGTYVIPGAALLSLVFSGTFAGMGLIEDRAEGSLRAALISPAPRAALAFSRIIGASVIALVQAAPILIVGLLLGLRPTPLGAALAVIALAFAAITASAAALTLAWIIDSPRGYHGVLNVGAMPLWLLSGAVFPADGASAWMKIVALCNPAGWMHAAIAGPLDLNPLATSPAAWPLLIATATASVIAASLIIGRGKPRA